MEINDLSYYEICIFIISYKSSTRQLHSKFETLSNLEEAEVMV